MHVIKGKILILQVYSAVFCWEKGYTGTENIVSYNNVAYRNDTKNFKRNT